jgi:hypothetical protein
MVPRELGQGELGAIPELSLAFFLLLAGCAADIPPAGRICGGECMLVKPCDPQCAPFTYRADPGPERLF